MSGKRGKSAFCQTVAGKLVAASGKGCDKSERWGVGDRGRRGRRWRTKEKKKTKRGMMKGKRKRIPAPKEKSEKVWSNSRACCYLNPSRTAWVLRGWRGILSSSRYDENIRRITFDNDPCDGIFTLHVWRKQLLRDDGFALPTAWSSRARGPKVCVWRWKFLKDDKFACALMRFSRYEDSKAS